MSNIACEMLPGGGFIMRRAEECSEADRAKNFYCIHCRVRVYLHLPEAGRGISPYFSADSSRTRRNALITERICSGRSPIWTTRDPELT